MELTADVRTARHIRESAEICQRDGSSLKERFEAIDEMAEYNQLKVIKAMQEARVSDIHFAGTTGYGYNDLGRDTLEEVYARRLSRRGRPGAPPADLRHPCPARGPFGQPAPWR